MPGYEPSISDPGPDVTKGNALANYMIIGGHGKVALLAAPLLVAEGHCVTSIIRNPEHIEAVEATGASAHVLDIEAASVPELATLFATQDAIIWSAGAGGGNPDRTYAVDRDAAIRAIDAAAQAGVDRFVMVSYHGASTNHGVPPDNSFFPYAEAKAAADAHLRASHLKWTILGPTTLTLEEPTGKISLGTELGRDPAQGTVSRGNVARTIAAALSHRNTIGKDLPYSDGEVDIAEAFARVQ